MYLFTLDGFICHFIIFTDIIYYVRRVIYDIKYNEPQPVNKLANLGT